MRSEQRPVVSKTARWPIYLLEGFSPPILPPYAHELAAVKLAIIIAVQSFWKRTLRGLRQFRMRQSFRIVALPFAAISGLFFEDCGSLPLLRLLALLCSTQSFYKIRIYEKIPLAVE